MTYTSNLPPESQAAAAVFPKNHYTPYNGAGIFITSLNASQIALEVLSEVAKAATRSPLWGWAIYEGSKIPPVIPAMSGVFSTLELASHTGPLITTCPITTLQSKIALGPQVVYYVNDPVILQYLAPEILQQVKDATKIFVAKNQNHATFLREKFGITVQYIVDRFNLAELEKVIQNEFYRKES